MFLLTASFTGPTGADNRLPLSLSSTRSDANAWRQSATLAMYLDRSRPAVSSMTRARLPCVSSLHPAPTRCRSRARGCRSEAPADRGTNSVMAANSSGDTTPLMDAQRAVLDTCTAAVDDPSLRVLPGRTYCFLNLFDEWLQRERGAQLPLRNNFTELLSEYLDTSEGEALNSYVGLDCDQRVSWIASKFITDIVFVEKEPERLIMYRDRWDAFVKAQNQASPPAAGSILQSCELWVQRIVLDLSACTRLDQTGERSLNRRR